MFVCACVCDIMKMKPYTAPSVISLTQSIELFKPDIACSKAMTYWGRDKMATIFADDSFICIFLNENSWISNEISLKYVPYGLIDN